jgi:uncharacterized protein involved in response to NO
MPDNLRATFRGPWSAGFDAGFRAAATLWTVGFSTFLGQYVPMLASFGAGRKLPNQKAG